MISSEHGTPRIFYLPDSTGFLVTLLATLILSMPYQKGDCGGDQIGRLLASPAQPHGKLLADLDSGLDYSPCAMHLGGITGAILEISKLSKGIGKKVLNVKNFSSTITIWVQASFIGRVVH